MKKQSASLPILIAELLLTVCVCAAIVLSNVAVVRNEAEQYTSEVASDYGNLENRYVSVFKAMTIHVREMIATDPTFDEMNAWLQSVNGLFADAVGADVFDGFAMTYKGGYAHSWNYGDYTNYDPASRPWYQAAQHAGGEVVVVAPYVTYLDSSYLSSDQYIELTIAQKYSDDISFDLDLKIPEINALLENRAMKYAGTSAYLFNGEGYILSTTDSALYSHNVNVPDGAVSEELSARLLGAAANAGRLTAARCGGKTVLLYASTDDAGNTYCVMIPFWALFAQKFLLVALAAALLILLEIIGFLRSRSVFVQMTERDDRIAEIARAAFQRQIYVDLATMKCSGAGWDVSADAPADYREAFRQMRLALSDGNLRDEFSAVFSPDALAGAESSRLLRRKYPFDLPREDGTRARRFLELNLFVSTLRGKKTAVILGNDVTDKELDQRRILQSIAHHYSAVFVGNAAQQRLDPIKTDPYFEAANADATGTQEVFARIAERFVRDDFASVFLSAVSFPSIGKRLETSDGYSLTAALKDGHWETIRVIRSERYESSREFIIFVENADEQMRQQAQLEAALNRANEAVRAKTDFLSRMSHDIRTPMNGIIGMTRIAREQDNPPRTADCLSKIDISSKYLLGLINDILDMSKIESGGFGLHPEPYPAAEFFRYLDSVVRPLCDAKHQKFIVEGNTDTGRIPLLDKLRINQIVFNLLSNAVKYTPEGGTIRYRVDEAPLGDKLDLTITVSDNGRGMSPAFQKVLFEPFTQEDRVRNMESMTSSSGLGLAIVKRIVDLMGGTIRVESRVNEGSTFVIRAPAECVSAEEYSAQARGSSAGSDTSRLSGRRALLCEDNRLNQEIARSVLERVGITAELADNGLTAVQRFAASPPGRFDWILMDLRMPIMDGYEATEKIRALPRPDARSVPIVAMTADAFDEDVKKCLAAGMDGHIAKPLDPTDVYGVLSGLVRGPAPSGASGGVQTP